jgi:hypothetical protein
MKSHRIPGLVSASAFAVMALACGAESPRSDGENTGATSQAFTTYVPWTNIEIASTGLCLHVIPGTFGPESLDLAACNGSDPLQAFQAEWPYVYSWEQQCLIAQYVSAADGGGKLEGAGCVGSTAEQWTYDGNHEMHNVWTGACAVSCAGKSCDDGPSFVECEGNDSAEYMNFWTYYNPQYPNALQALRGRCLDDNGPHFAQGKQLQTWDCLGNGAQQFEYNSATHAIEDRYTGMCLDILGFNGNNGAIVDEWPCDGLANQSWTITSDNQIVSNWNGKCMEVQNYGLQNGALVQMNVCYGGFNQIWQNALN